MKIRYLRLAYAQNPYLRFSTPCGPVFWIVGAEGKQLRRIIVFLYYLEE